MRNPLRISRRSDQIADDVDGCLRADGRILGTYVHGLFQNAELRRNIVRRIAA